MKGVEALFVAVLLSVLGLSSPLVTGGELVLYNCGLLYGLVSRELLGEPATDGRLGMLTFVVLDSRIQSSLNT